MYLRDAVSIDRSAEVVWTIVGDPECIPLWNPRLVEIRQMLTQACHVGTRYHCTYAFNRKRATLQGEVIEYDPPRRLALRLHGDALAWNADVVESYTVTPEGHGARVVQEIQINNSGIPWYVRTLVWCIHKFGKPTGKPFLHELKTLVETLEKKR